MTTRSISHGTFTLERRYPATRARVWKALSDPVSKKKWFGGPDEWGPDVHSMDFRIGGIETNEGGPKGGPVHKFVATYEDIVPEERIIYSYVMYLDATRISVSVASFELKPDGDGTHLVLTEMGAFLDGSDDGSERARGTELLLDALGAYLVRSGAN